MADKALDTRTTEDDLVERISHGDRAAFSELYSRMATRVGWQVRRRLVDAAQSEEVVQEVFLEIWQRASRFDSSRGHAATWILTMAAHRAIDRVRTAQADRTRDLVVGIRNQQVPFDLTVDAAETSLEYRRVEVALGRITKVQRQALVLSYQHGRTNQEIADLLELPIGTVKTRLRDGLIRLRRELVPQSA
jgi:RNA polymerase sigma-70 factor (ECF subfamily)